VSGCCQAHHPRNPPFLAGFPFLAPPTPGAAFLLGAAFLAFLADLKSSPLPSSASGSLSAGVAVARGDEAL
jgi:hypothetical protein